MTNDWESMDLMLFDGGAGAGTGAAAGGEGTNEAGEGMTGMDAASQRAEEQTADAAQETPQRNLRSEWNKLKNSEEYKQFFTEDTQGIINKRFGDDKALRETIKRQQALVEKVAARYGTNANDLDALDAAIDGDKKFLQEQADAHGMTTEQYVLYNRAVQQEKAKEAQMQWVRKREDEARFLSMRDPSFDLGRELGDKRFADMVRGDYPLEAAYSVSKFAKANPGVNIDQELANPEIDKLLRVNFPMDRAYNMVHHDELMQNGMQYAAQTAQKQVTDDIRARGMRPKEGAGKGNGGMVPKLTASDLSEKDLKDYNRRLIRGDKPKYEDYVKRR